MYFSKMIGRRSAVLLWDQPNEQHCEVAIGRRSLYWFVIRFKELAPAAYHAPVLDCRRGMLSSGLEFILLRRWHIGVTVQRDPSLRAELQIAADALEDERLERSQAA